MAKPPDVRVIEPVRPPERQQQLAERILAIWREDQGRAQEELSRSGGRVMQECACSNPAKGPATSVRADSSFPCGSAQ